MFNRYFAYFVHNMLTYTTILRTMCYMNKKNAKPETAIIEFTVRNFRSIKDSLSLSFVAGKSRTNTFYVPAIDTHLLRSIAIYGANSSGKSNLIWALFLVRQLIQGDTLLSDADGLEPFMLDDTTRNSSTTFEAHFVHRGSTYIYFLEIDAQKRVVLRERLRVLLPNATTSRTSLVFDRKLNDVAVSSNLPTDVHGISRLMTRTITSSQLLVTVLAGVEKENIAHDVSEAWANMFIYNTSDHERSLWNRMVRMLYDEQINEDDDSSIKDSLLEVLARADLSIVDLEVRESGDDNLELFFGHRYRQDDNTLGTQYFTLNDESKGTIKFLSLLPPFLISIHRGCPIILDELDSNLHPVLLRLVIGMFNASDTNAQLLMTSHDVNLMDDRSLLTKDQIYFVEKQPDHSSTLYSLSEFPNIRNNTPNLSKRYLAGEFGARANVAE